MLVDMVRAGLENSGLPGKYWSNALLHAVYIKNRLPRYAFDHKQTPYERLTNFKPDRSNLRVFGCPIVTKNLVRDHQKYQSTGTQESSYATLK